MYYSVNVHKQKEATHVPRLCVVEWTGSAFARKRLGTIGLHRLEKAIEKVETVVLCGKNEPKASMDRQPEPSNLSHRLHPANRWQAGDSGADNLESD